MMVFIVLLGSALMVSERIPGVRFRDLPPLRPHLATDALYLLTGFVLLGLLTEALVMRAATLSGSLTGIADLWPVAPGIVQIACALVMIDLGNYVAHWCLHRVDSLWELHKVHHSSPTLDVMATFRSHVGEQLVRRVLAPAGVVMAGMPMNAVLAASGIFFVWAMANHANVRVSLGPLERHLVTPRRHRAHHVPATTERNLGTVFTWWDRLRGTLVDADDPAPGTPFGFPRQPLDYPGDWARQFVEPFRGDRRATAVADARASRFHP